MIARCMAPVKEFCIKNQHSLKIDKTDRKTQEICRFILQEGCNLGQKKKAVLTELPFSKALHSCPLLLFIVRRPRQIHEEQRQRDGRQEAQDIIFFSQQGREGAGDDVPVGIIEEIEVGVKRLIQKVDGQSSASIAPGIQRAYSSSLHQFLSVIVLYRQTKTLILHRCRGR